MSEKKELSQSFKERFASELKERSKGTKKKEKQRLKNLEEEQEKQKRCLNPRQNRVDINNSDTLDGKNPTLKVFDY